MKARPSDIECENEVFFFSRPDLTFGRLDRLAEGSRGLVRGECGFEDDEFAQVYTLTHRDGVVGHQGPEFLGHQPATDKGMTFGQYEDRVEPDLFEASSEQKCGVQTGRNAPIENDARGAHLLTIGFKTCGWQRVSQT